MSDKQISGSVANYMMNAAGHLAKLQVEFNELKWQICYGENKRTNFLQVRSECRKLIKELEMADFCYRSDIEDAADAADDEQQPAIRQVK